MYENILRAVADVPWAITPAKLDQIMAVLDLRVRGLHVDAATVEAVAAASRRDRQPRTQRDVAVLPILGTLTQRADIMTQASGFSSTDAVGQTFDALMADASVYAIVLDVDSPGGQAVGVQELSDKIYSARGQKPIVAVANSEAASAAYWIASAADEMVVTPSGQVGSVGALAVHMDVSAANEQEGIKPTYITYGKYKAEHAGDMPLSPEGLESAQAMVDSYGRQFEKDLARNRGASVATVRETYGQGRMYRAADAIGRGMADRTATLSETVQRLQDGAFRRKRQTTQSARNRLSLIRHGGRISRKSIDP